MLENLHFICFLLSCFLIRCRRRSARLFFWCLRSPSFSSFILLCRMFLLLFLRVNKNGLNANKLTFPSIVLLFSSPLTFSFSPQEEWARKLAMNTRIRLKWNTTSRKTQKSLNIHLALSSASPHRREIIHQSVFWIFPLLLPPSSFRLQLLWKMENVKISNSLLRLWLCFPLFTMCNAHDHRPLCVQSLRTVWELEFKV